MKLLILTDHRGHTANNSLYAITRALVADERVGEVRIASRGTAANASFYTCSPSGKTLPLHATRASDEFAFDAQGSCFDESRLTPTPLTWPDLVFLRIPHPVPGTWFTYLREAFAKTRIINRPEGIAATTSKEWLLNVPELCAPMQLCASPTAVQAFAKTRPSVLKPLAGYGGRGILRAGEAGVQVGSKTVTWREWPNHGLAQQPYLAVEFLPRVSEGDKRIVVVDGEVIGAVLRVPAEGHWLANVSQGAHAEPAELSFAERRIVDALAPHMNALGIVMYGIDTLIGNDGQRVLSEVNTMSVGGVTDLPPANGRTAAQRTAAALLRAAPPNSGPR